MAMRKYAKWAAVAFAVFMIFNRPAEAANITNDGWSKVKDAGDSLSIFVTKLDG